MLHSYKMITLEYYHIHFKILERNLLNINRSLSQAKAPHRPLQVPQKEPATVLNNYWQNTYDMC